MTDSDPIVPKAPAGVCAIPDPLRRELKNLEPGEALLMTDGEGRIYVVMNWEDLRMHFKGGTDGRPN